MMSRNVKKVIELKTFKLYNSTTVTSKKYRYQTVKQKDQSKQKTITWYKKTQTTWQHEPLWKIEVQSGAPEG